MVVIASYELCHFERSEAIFWNDANNFKLLNVAFKSTFINPKDCFAMLAMTTIYRLKIKPYSPKTPTTI